jgi:hypothetical protein
MENIKFDDNRKKLIKAFRAKVCNGQKATREIFLAYAFLRGRPYIDLESKINEDNFGEGKFTFLRYLSCLIGMEIKKASEPINIEYNRNDTVDAISLWIKEKYEEKVIIPTKDESEHDTRAA